jgi:hypothetical protein
VKIRARAAATAVRARWSYVLVRSGWIVLVCAFWTAGFTPRPPDIGSVRCTLIFQVSNRTIGCILDRSARLYGDCMEPDHMAKYSLPMLTDLTENLIRKKLFMC